jgi:HTH-type transcriptional regulator/antitoxin HipB
MKTKVSKSLYELGNLIQSERKSRHLTQTQLGEITGTSINFISQIEAGKPTAQIGKVFHVLQVLGFELITSRGSRGLVVKHKVDIK